MFTGPLGQASASTAALAASATCTNEEMPELAGRAPVGSFRSRRRQPPGRRCRRWSCPGEAGRWCRAEWSRRQVPSLAGMGMRWSERRSGLHRPAMPRPRGCVFPAIRIRALSARFPPDSEVSWWMTTSGAAAASASMTAGRSSMSSRTPRASRASSHWTPASVREPPVTWCPALISRGTRRRPMAPVPSAMKMRVMRGGACGTHPAAGLPAHAPCPGRRPVP
jgi:hypothetical protein